MDIFACSEEQRTVSNTMLQDVLHRGVLVCALCLGALSMYVSYECLDCGSEAGERAAAATTLRNICMEDDVCDQRTNTYIRSIGSVKIASIMWSIWKGTHQMSPQKAGTH